MSFRPKSFSSFVFCVGLTLVALTGCGGSKRSCSSAEGRRAIVADVDAALSKQSCAEALAIIEEFYPQADCASDEIRTARASANACAANVNFFTLLDGLANSDLAGAEMWVSLTRLFPSSPSDQRVTAGQNSLDALFSLRIPGILTPPQYMVNATSANPGTLVAAHRSEDSNLYGMLVSMSLVGALQNRYGAPAANFHKTQKLGAIAGNPDGWEIPTSVDVNACTYAGAILSMFDSIGQVSTTIGSSLGGSVGTALTTAATAFSAAMNSACDDGCDACGLPAGTCSTCPIELRNRLSCTGVATDAATCAATGIVEFMNSNPLGWPN